MLSLLNAYADGYVAVPVIHACKKQGLFKILQEKQWIEFSQLVKALEANTGYLKIALHLLESLGWVLRNDADAYRVTDIAQWEELPETLVELYEISPDTIFQTSELQRLVCFWINFFIQRHSFHSTSASISWKDRLEGTLFIPLLPALQGHVVMQKGRMIINLPPPLQEAIIKLFVHYEWGKQIYDTIILSDSGNQLMERLEVIGIAASYRPMLAQMKELLFGNPAEVFKKKPDGTESHIDRKRNVLASGFQHGRYFKDAEKQILLIFNQLPFEKQPRYIADMGCGDGTFLKSIYYAICENSERGKVLEEYPLTLLGIDYNEVALQTTEKNLKGLPHILLQGDINEPQQLLRDLKARGVNDVEAILHVRSFLDHNFHGITSTGFQSSIANFPLLPGSVYVDMHGELLPSSEVLEAWQHHFVRWATVIYTHGLMVLEAHCLSSTLTHAYLGQSENFYFDHLHAFSGQYLIEAEIFLLLAARVGLFPKIQPLRYPKTLPFCRVTLSHLEKRNYIIRHACKEDLKQLEVLEQHYWTTELKTSAADLEARIQFYPQGQFVLELDGEVVGAIYSQRITSQDTVFAMEADTAGLFHVPDGSFVQLLALNVLPEMEKNQIDHHLLEWMLQRCSVMNGIEGVVSVTLCKNAHLEHTQQLADYIYARDTSGHLFDPFLHFHELHGGTVVGLIPNYRPSDTQNKGQGVLVYYDIHGRHADHYQKSSSEHSALVQSSKQGLVNNIVAYIETLIRKCLAKDGGQTFAHDQSLMDMGLDSADILEITLQVNRQYQLELNFAFFFRYNTLQKIITYVQEHLNPREC